MINPCTGKLRVGWRISDYACLACIAALLCWFSVSGLRAIHCDRLKDFAEFLAGARALDSGQDLYAAGELGYIYPPLLAWLLIPLSRLADHEAAVVWLFQNLFVQGLVLVLATRDAVSRVEPKVHEGRTGLFAPAVALLAFGLMADKLRADAVMGQCNALLTLCWVTALICLDRFPVFAGVVIGFSANVKYITLVSVPYLVVRRRYKAAATAVIFTVFWALVPATTLGWSTNWQYIVNATSGLTRMASARSEVVESRHHSRAAMTEAHAVAPGRTSARIAGLSDIRSLSISSSLARLTGRPINTIVTFSLVATAFAVFTGVIWRLYRRAGLELVSANTLRHQGRLLVAAEWSGLLVVTLAFGPQTNPRHFVLLLPMVTLLAAIILSSSELWTKPRLWLAAGTCLLYLGLVLPPGTDRLKNLVNDWREVSGVSWCLLLAYTSLVAFVLRPLPAIGAKTDNSGAARIAPAR